MHALSAMRPIATDGVAWSVGLSVCCCYHCPHRWQFFLAILGLEHLRLNTPAINTKFFFIAAFAVQIARHNNKNDVSTHNTVTSLCPWSSWPVRVATQQWRPQWNYLNAFYFAYVDHTQQIRLANRSKNRLY